MFSRHDSRQTSSGFALDPRHIISTLLLGTLVVFILCATAVPSFGQGLGFGNITGVVQDTTGAVITGAKVTVTNPSKGITREMETSSAGAFSAPALVPASGYVVAISKQGFAPVEVKDVIVQVGETVNLNPILKVAGGTETVEVTMKAPMVDTTKVDTSSVVDSTQILGLPTSGRRVDQFVLLTPGVTNDGNFGLLSFRGNPGGNSFLTDGVDTTNSYYDENAGRTRTYNISQDAVQEFEVVSSNFLAEFGKASGGVVNTVTRSGSNSFHGSAYEFFRNTTLNAKDRNTVSGLLPSGINPPAYRHLAGLSIGGPIKKDKLFFFFNGELLRRIDPAFSSNIGSSGQGNNVFDGLGNITARDTCVTGGPLAGGSVRLPSGAIVPGPTAAQCATAIAYLKSRALPQLVPRKFDNNLLFGKIDWRPTAKDSFSISANYLDFRSPNGIQSSGIAFTTGNAIGNNADTNVFDRTARVSWTRIITNNILNELRYGFFVDRQFDPNSPSLLPSWGSFGPSPVQLTLDSVINLGYATNYPRLNPRETRNEVADNLSWTKGQHNFKFGAAFANVADHVISMASQFPTYTYSAVSGGANALTLFALDINGTTPQGNQAWTSYSQTVGNRQVDYDLWETSLYAQDQWRITPKLTITAGVRFEHSTVPQPSVCNPLFPQTCTIPDKHNTSFAPRLGIAYALGSKTAIHAGFGMFYNRYTTAAIENLLVTNGVYQLGYSNPTITSAEFAKAGHGVLGCLPTFPNLEPFNFVATGACARSITPNILYADPNYRPAYSEQMSLAIDRELFKNTSLSVSYVWSRSLHLPVSYDTNVLDPTFNLTYKVLDTTGAVVGSYTTPIYTSFNPAYTFSGSQYKGRVSVAQSAANSYYNALLVNLKHRYSNWLQGDVSYTYGHTIDWNVGFAPTFGSAFPTSYVNGNYRGDKGSSSLDRRHLLVMNAVFSPTFMSNNGAVAKYLVNGWQFSFIELLASSQPLFPGFFSASMPTSGATGTAIATANGFPLGTSMISSSSLNGLGGLGRIPFESMSALNLGAWYRTDARLSKTFPITERFKVNLGVEAFNLFNSLIPTSRDASQYQVAFPAAGQTGFGFGTLTPRSQYGTITATIDALNGTNSRRANAFVRITW